MLASLVPSLNLGVRLKYKDSGLRVLTLGETPQVEGRV